MPSPAAADTQRLARQRDDGRIGSAGRSEAGRTAGCPGFQPAASGQLAREAARTRGARARRRSAGCRRFPQLLPPFSAPRSTTSAMPSQRHITPKVWQTASSAASRSARIASNSPKSRGSHAGSSLMPCDPRRRRHSDADRDAPARPSRDRCRGARRAARECDDRGARRTTSRAPASRRHEAPRSWSQTMFCTRVDDGVMPEIRPAVVHVEHARCRSSHRRWAAGRSAALDAREREDGVRAGRGTTNQRRRPGRASARNWQSKGIGEE